MNEALREVQKKVVEAKTAPARPEFGRYGAGFKAEWPPNVCMHVPSLRESSRDGIHAEVMVYWGGVRVEWDLSLNLGSSRTRESFAKRLAEISPHFDWSGAIRQLAEQVIETHREGEPVEQLDQGGDISTNVGWLVEPILPAGQTCMLYADSKTGKSLFVLWLASGLVEKIPLPGLKLPEEPTPVLYLDWETEADTQRRRLEKLAKGFPMLRRPKVAYRRMQRPLLEDLPRVLKAVDDTGAKLVILDSLAAACGDNLNDGSVAAALMNAMRAIPATRIILHHISHAGAEGGGANPFGSRFFRHYSRAVWELRNSQNGPVNRIGLFQRSANESGELAEPLGFAFRFEPNGGISVSSCKIQEDRVLAEGLPPRERITIRLEESAASVKDLADELNLTPDAVRKALERDKKRFQIIQGGKGKPGTVWGLREECRRDS